MVARLAMTAAFALEWIGHRLGSAYFSNVLLVKNLFGKGPVNAVGAGEITAAEGHDD
jgi:hypothetical protein